MPRPKTPLISRRKTLEVALEIIDTEGLDALSIRRLAEALNVNGASLYHHFKNKDDILVGVAHLALAEVLPPDTRDEAWQVWILRNAHRLHSALLKHPNLVPVILHRGPLGIGSEQMEESARLLQEEGVPIGYIHVLLRGLEIIALGSVLEETQGEDTDGVPVIQRDEYPLLYQSSKDRTLDQAELFDALARATIRMVDESIQQDRLNGVKSPGRISVGASGSKKKSAGVRQPAAKTTLSATAPRTSPAPRKTLAKKPPAVKATAPKPVSATRTTR
jgi:TetR/AcrR family tetracycline transcriptional repressor